MHGNDCFGFEQLASIRRLARAHGEVIADRQHDNLRRIELPDDGHISKNIYIAGVVNLDSIFKFNNVPTRFATVNQLIAVLNAARVVGMHHGDFDISDSLCATLVHHQRLFGAFFLQPSAQLRHADYLRFVLLDNLDCIPNVVPVPG